MSKREFQILLAIVFVDLLTKLIVNYFLPFNEHVYVFGEYVSLYLTYNQGALGGQGEYILEGVGNTNVAVIVVCLAGLILLSYILFIRKKNVKPVYKILGGISLYLVLAVVMETAIWHFSNFNVSVWTASVVGKVTGIIIYGSLFYLSQDKLIRLSLLPILSAGLGNLLSHFYIPFKVIDFISIKGSYETLRIGIFNIADLAFYLGAIALVISLVIFLSRKLGNTITKLSS